MLQQLQGQNRAIIRAIQSLEQKMDRRFEEADQKNELRFSALEAAVRQNSSDIRQNSADIVALKQELAGVKDEIGGLTRRVERIEQVLRLKLDGPGTADLDARIRRIELQLGPSTS